MIRLRPAFPIFFLYSYSFYAKSFGILHLLISASTLKSSHLESLLNKAKKLAEIVLFSIEKGQETR